jgi:hypothetical protein
MTSFFNTVSLLIHTLFTTLNKLLNSFREKMFLVGRKAKWCTACLTSSSLPNRRSSIFKHFYSFINFSLSNTLIILLWISEDLIPSSHRNLMAARCSLMVHSESGASMFIHCLHERDWCLLGSNCRYPRSGLPHWVYWPWITRPTYWFSLTSKLPLLFDFPSYVLSAYQEKIPAKNAIYAHAQDFSAGD